MFSWWKELFLAATMVVVVIASSFITSWYMGRDIRPLILTGMILYFTTAFALGMRRRWRNARYSQTANNAGRFSLAELLIFVTGLAFFIGILAMERLASERLQQERKELQASVARVLGPDGRIHFEPDGSLGIAICDRTFDDARLAQLANMIFQWKADTKVSRVLFGSGINTNNTPPVWPGITDQSIPLLMQWQELELLSVYGTAISTTGLAQLQSLTQLNEHSQRMLNVKSSGKRRIVNEK